MPFKNNNETIIYDINRLDVGDDYEYILEGKLLVLVTLKEVPLKAVIKDEWHNYKIVQHTSQTEKGHNRPLFVYICEEL